jgi:type IV secretion system protein TrbE
MIDALTNGFERVIEKLTGGGQDRLPASRINRSEMPNGFFLNNLLWFGDGGSAKTAISRGFIVEPGEMMTCSNSELNTLHEKLRMLLGFLGQEYTVQIQWSIDSDYRQELEKYHAETLKLRRVDPYYGKFGVLIRGERYERYKRAMEEERLRRERLYVYFSRILDTRPKKPLRDLAQYYFSLSERESQSLAEFGSHALNRLFPDSKIQPMRDRDNFLFYYRFLNTSASRSSEAMGESFDPAFTIQQNTMLGEGIVPSDQPGVSFWLDGFYNAMFVVRQWPRRTFPGIISSLTNLGFKEYAITLNIYPRDVEKVIDTEEKTAQRLIIDAASERKQSLVEQAKMKQETIAELESGRTIPLSCLFAIRVWHKDRETLRTRCELLRNAVTAMGGAQIFQGTVPETARRLFYQTWPGWTQGTYRNFDLPAEDKYLADLIPWSATFTGHLDGADAIYNGARGNLVGIKLRIGNTPQHGVVLGMSGAGKSMTLNDLIAQAGGKFGFLLFVEEGLSYGTLTQTLGCDPIIVSPDGGLTINYLDTNETPLSPTSLILAANFCMLMCGDKEISGERAKERQALLVESLQQMYWDFFRDWQVEHEEAAEELRWRAYAVHRYRLTRMRSKDSSFTEAFVEMRDWELREPGAAEAFIRERGAQEVAEFSQNHLTSHYVRDLAFAYFRPEQCPVHSSLVEALEFSDRSDAAEKSECKRLAKMLKRWSVEGQYGAFIDGIGNVRIDGRVAHFELGKIPEEAQEQRALANFLVTNYARQKIISMPRAVPKIAIFEEASRSLDVPGGVRMIQEYYRQMRKFGCNILAVIQQYDVIRDSPVRSAMIGNSKMYLITAQQSRDDAQDIGRALKLSSRAVDTIMSYTLPELQPPQERYCALTYVANDQKKRLVGTIKNVASRELIYAAASDNETFDGRQKQLGGYDDIVEGIISESQSIVAPAEERATDPIF